MKNPFLAWNRREGPYSIFLLKLVRDLELQESHIFTKTVQRNSRQESKKN
jgi:hypothetical protein